MSKAELLKRAPKAITHLRAQRNRRRLGLIFGSGASSDLGFPKWQKLVQLIAGHADVQATDLLTQLMPVDRAAAPVRSLASITQILFNRFRHRQITSKGLASPLTFLQEQQIKTEWLKIIHGNLYSGIDAKTRSNTIKKHKYLTAFLELIKTLPLTVNYNFDDTLEKMLLDARKGDESNSTRGYEVVDRPAVQFQKDSGVIYHPNGFLPFVFEDGASSDVVFSDNSFQDELINAATGKYINLSNYLFRNTCLLVGLSLDDVTLQSLLRQNAVANPGNIHYFVHFETKGARLDKNMREIIFSSNFESYNLYTVFLDNNGIRDLAELITMTVESFELNHPAKEKFVYYLVGSIGAGKSTATGNFRNLTTYDEWIDERKPEAAVPEKGLARSTINNLNKYFVEQFRKKNFAIWGNKDGIHVVDRCPLDPLTFGEADERSSKAKALLEGITDNGARTIAPGHVIHLDCDLADVKYRCSLKHKYWSDGDYQKLLDSAGAIYGGISKTIICTRGRDANAVAREIARVIFLEKYHQVDVQAELRKVAGATP